MSGKRLNPFQHALKRPDTYIGSIKTLKEDNYVLSDGVVSIKEVNINKGLMNIIREIGSNCIDNKWRSEKGATPQTSIKISYDRETHKLTFWNDGNTISTQKENYSYEDYRKGTNIDEVMYPAEVFFGEMLAGTNFDDDEGQERKTSGRNGMGSKCLRYDTLIPLWDGKTVKAEDIQLGNKLIGDDGKPRNVTNVFHGTGQMYKVDQKFGEPYFVNDEHILTLHMPDHKVIFWNSSKNGWTVLWWDNDNLKICAKTENIGTSPVKVCEECNVEFKSDISRHYRRQHPTIAYVPQPRKTPSKNSANPDDPEVLLAKDRLEKFCETISDNNVFDVSIKDFLNLNKTTQNRLAGVRGKCVEWEKRDVALDPYILGLWLGDGYATGYGYACDKKTDTEVMDYIQNWAHKHDVKIKQTGLYAYSFSSISNHGKLHHAPLKKLLSQYDLIKNKHIPKEYLQNDRDTRLKVLAGLIDTDGTVMREGSRVVISQCTGVHTRLFEDMTYLARSLGLCCSTTIRKTTWTYDGEKKTGVAHCLNISGDALEDLPTLLPRKKCASTKKINTSKTTGAITISDVGIDKYVGITIDQNQRFLVNDFTVTHNCTNVFSTEFTVRHADASDQKQFLQVYTNNAKNRTAPKLTKYGAKTSFTEISFIPDFKTFNYDIKNKDVENDFVGLLGMYVMEIAAVTALPVHFNDGISKKIYHYKTFDKYVRMFYPDALKHKIAFVKLKNGDECIVIESHTDEEEIEAKLLPETLENIRHVSFVNGVRTKSGGVHVDAWRDAIVPVFVRAFNARKGKSESIPKTSAKEVYPYITIFLRTEVDKPSFDQQTKDLLNGPPYRLSPVGNSTAAKDERARIKTEIEKLVAKMLKWNFIPLLENKLLRKNNIGGFAVSSRPKGRINFGKKTTDANHAGKVPGCILYISEGISAKALCVRGITSLDRGNDTNGVFAIQGKFINVTKATLKEIKANPEVQMLMKMANLEFGVDYSKPENFKNLRYQYFRLATDMDDDGIHIRGLLINFFFTFWPELSKMKCISTISTGVNKIMFTKKKDANNNLIFYTTTEYKKWYEDIGKNTKVAEIKYLKGLASIDAADVPRYFTDMKCVTYYPEGDEKEYIKLGFSDEKCYIDLRKEWIKREMTPDDFTQTFNDILFLEHEKDDYKYVYDGKLSISEFIDKQLIIYHTMTLSRAIPNIMDGFKEGQRKVFYSIRKRNYKNNQDLEKVTGAIKELSGYMHGAASLYGTIRNMAIRYPGSNNIPLLASDGEFGTRLSGPAGDDSGQPRYISTGLEPLAEILFPREDDALLKQLYVTGSLAEYEYFAPILCTLLINGSEGIATGFSTNIPCYNPEDILAWTRAWIDGKHKKQPHLVPWYRGITGPITLEYPKGHEDGSVHPTRWISSGVLVECQKGCKLIVGKKKCNGMNGWWHITDLPVGLWTNTFKEHIEYLESCTPPSGSKLKKLENRCLTDYSDYNTANLVHFMIKPAKNWEPCMDTTLKKMKAGHKLGNMVLLDTNGYPVKYDSVDAIIEAWCIRRLALYEARYNHLLEIYETELLRAKNKYIYVKAVVDKKLNLHQEDEDVEKDLKKLGLVKLTSTNVGGKKDEDDEDDGIEPKKVPSYKYLLSMQMQSMTCKKLSELLNDKSTLQAKIDMLKTKTSKDLWKEDLVKFEIAYAKYIKNNPLK